jgi:hypothetical protein
VSRPRVLLVPALTELEWRIRPQVEGWAEVATFNAPGIGDEPPAQEPGLGALVERGLAEIEAQGWDRYVVAGDEFGSITAIQIAAARPAATVGLALGHACVKIEREGARPTISKEMIGAFERLRRTDYRTYVRHLTQMTQGAYDDEMAERYMELVPQAVEEAYSGFSGEAGDTEQMIASLAVPLLLVKHDGCLLWTEEAWEDATAAFPDATRGQTRMKPSADPAFSEMLRRFCEPLFAAG